MQRKWPLLTLMWPTDSEVTKGTLWFGCTSAEPAFIWTLPELYNNENRNILKLFFYNKTTFVTNIRYLWFIQMQNANKKKYNIKISWSEDFKMASYYPISKSFGGRRKEMRAQYCEMWQWKTSPHLLIIINIVRDKPSYSSRTIQTLKTSKSLASTRLVTNNSNKPKC